MIRFRNIALTAALGAAACIGFWLEQPVALASDSSIAAAATPANDGKGKILFYRAPMSSDVSSVPKKDEMGMDYIPIYEGDASSEPGSVSLSAERIQKLGVRTAIVEQRDLMQPIHIVGTVQIDEARQTVIAPRFEGWIAKLYVNTTGQKVKKGEVLFDFYSPQLIQIENEYLVTHSDAPNKNGDKHNGSLEKLRVLAIPDAEIQRLQHEKMVNNGVAFRAPSDATVIEKQAIDGMKFAPGDTLYRLANLDNIWVIGSVYEQDLSRIALGQVVSVTVNAYPGKTFEGKVSFIYPDINKDTRTAKIRIDLPNPDGVLRTDMYADATINVIEMNKVLTVPISAVLNSGERQAVLIDMGKGRFKPQAVKIGKHGGDYVEIIDGLKEGDRIITSANFLIDAESNLRAALASFTAPASGEKQ